MSWKRWKRRKAPSFHKNDAISYRYLELFEVPKDFWYDRSWKDTTKRRHQYRVIEVM